MSDMVQKTNVIHCGDNLKIMREMESESVDLIYLDPPFFSNRKYETVWGDKQETQSFDDRWEGGMYNYIEWMSERLTEIRRILKSTGSIYLHVDHHAVHYLKVEMDKIFGYNNFRTEITWRRCRPKGNAKTFSNNSDYILYYTKGKTPTFNVQYDKYLKSTLDVYNHDDNDGKGKYHLDNTSAPNGYKYDLGYGEKTPSRGYAWKEETMRQKIAAGLIDIRPGKVPTQKRYLSDAKGVPFDNIWTDINQVIGRESCGYPTQKPEALLDRIIKSSSNPDDIVFDPFCGCGTALAVAKKLGRQYIGIDVSPTACPVVADRLGVSHSLIIGMPVDPKDFRKMTPAHFQQWVCTRMSARNTSPDPKKTPPDGGVDGIVKSTVFTDKESINAPIQIKRNTTTGVGVNAIKNFFATMHDLKKTKGYFVAISFGKGAVEQVAKYKNEGSVEIILVKAEDIAEKGYFEK